MKKHKKLTEEYRAHDPNRGSFDPTPREPHRDHERNPYGVRHPFKTAQDYMPKDERPRVHEWQRRLAKMQQT